MDTPPLGERRRGGAAEEAGQAARALAAELAILRHGIGAAREAAAEWLPAMLASAVRVTDLAEAGASRVGGSLGELAGSLTRLATSIEVLDARVAEAAELASSDGLTGVLNRAGLDRRLRLAIEEAGRLGEPLSVVFCDLDGFKRFNDAHGHDVGDHALRLVASALAAHPDERKAVGRHGGEEFVLVMPGRAGEDALVAARAIAGALAGRVLLRRGTEEALGSVTLSAGVAEWRGPGEDAAGLLRRADGAMYRAKREGGNRAVLAVAERPAAAAAGW